MIHRFPPQISQLRLLPWSDRQPAVQSLLMGLAWLTAALIVCLFRFRFTSSPEGGAAFAGFVRQLGASVTCFAPWLAATPILARTVARLPLHGRRWWLHCAVHLAIALPVVYGVASIEAGLRGIAGMRALSASPLRLSPLAFLLQLIVYAGTVGVLETMVRAAAARRRERELADLRARRLELENDLRDAELEALRAKINPHFLFNALHNVAALVRVDGRAAERMLSRLGDVLRTALRLELASEVTLSQELEVTRAYLDLELLRFADRLSVAIDVEPEVMGALVPSLILQPLVENAIRHGISRVRGPADVRIDASRASRHLVIRIRDSGRGFEDTWSGGAAGSGVGLSVLRSRLEKLYGDEASCRCSNGAAGGAVVEVRLPYRPAERTAGAVA